jgi:hypothetical protein
MVGERSLTSHASSITLSTMTLSNGEQSSGKRSRKCDNNIGSFRSCRHHSTAISDLTGLCLPTVTSFEGERIECHTGSLPRPMPSHETCAIESIDLVEAYIDTKGFQAWLSPRFPKLRHLSISWCMDESNIIGHLPIVFSEIGDALRATAAPLERLYLDTECADWWQPFHGQDYKTSPPIGDLSSLKHLWVLSVDESALFGHHYHPGPEDVQPPLGDLLQTSLQHLQVYNCDFIDGDAADEDGDESLRGTCRECWRNCNALTKTFLC